MRMRTGFPPRFESCQYCPGFKGALGPVARDVSPGRCVATSGVSQVWVKPGQAGRTVLRRERNGRALGDGGC